MIERDILTNLFVWDCPMKECGQFGNMSEITFLPISALYQEYTVFVELYSRFLRPFDT
jgi:hypothetical protein